MNRFIVIEGLDGAGKTTLVKEILSTNPHKKIFSIKAPSQTFKVDLKKDNDELFNEFIGDMIELYEFVIKPALKDGYTVICDRWFYSAIVYQGLPKNVNGLKMPATPDVAYYINTDPKVARENAITRKNRDYFDIAPIEVYLKRAMKYKEISFLKVMSYEDILQDINEKI